MVPKKFAHLFLPQNLSQLPEGYPVSRLGIDKNTGIMSLIIGDDMRTSRVIIGLPGTGKSEGLIKGNALDILNAIIGTIIRFGEMVEKHSGELYVNGELDCLAASKIWFSKEYSRNATSSYTVFDPSGSLASGVKSILKAIDFPMEFVHIVDPRDTKNTDSPKVFGGNPVVVANQIKTIFGQIKSGNGADSSPFFTNISNNKLVNHLLLFLFTEPEEKHSFTMLQNVLSDKVYRFKLYSRLDNIISEKEKEIAAIPKNDVEKRFIENVTL